MRIGIPTESGRRERRVAAVPVTVKTFAGWGIDVRVQAGAGLAAGFDDADFVEAGAIVVETDVEAHDADVVLRVGAPTANEIALIPSGSVLVSFLDPFEPGEHIRRCVERGITAIAMEAVPRTTIAQSIDALSSQATAAGYSAVLLASSELPKLVPMLVTPAGTVRPAKALVLGVGVAGLQAIATARRLGAVVHAYDVRAETREHVESLGAHFVEAPTFASEQSGYAREVDEATAAAQHDMLASAVRDADMVITTAQVPGRRAPVLVTADMVAGMRAGSVVVDGAATSGGNVEGSQPDEVVVVGGVRIFAPTDLAGRVATDASSMFARNLQELLARMRTDEGDLAVALDDEVIGPCTITHRGEVIHPSTREVLGLTPHSEKEPIA